MQVPCELRGCVELRGVQVYPIVNWKVIYGWQRM